MKAVFAMALDFQHAEVAFVSKLAGADGQVVIATCAVCQQVLKLGHGGGRCRAKVVGSGCKHGLDSS